MNPVISVIIPVYNREKHIVKCIESVLSQSFEDFEVILIDDGSSDRSPQICDEYAQKDTRVKVIHKANGGVSSARNEGIKVACGEYITFVDSDDCLLPNFFECGNKKIKEYKPDLIVTGFKVTCCDEYNSIKEGEQIFCEDHFCTVEEILEEMNMPYFGYMAAPWGKLYKANIIKDNSLCFDTSMRWGEDTYFNLDFLEHTRNVYGVKNICYDYCLGTENSLSCDLHKDEYEVCSKMVKRKIKLHEQINISETFVKNAKEFFLKSMICHLRRCQICSKKITKEENIDLIKKISNDEVIKTIKVKDLSSLQRKIMLVLLRLKWHSFTLWAFNLYFKIRLKNKET